MPTVRGMAVEGNVYTGFLYAGLMIDGQGNPKVIEFNCRFGDPETQPIMLRMRSDLVELCLAACAGKLDQVEAIYDPRVAIGVVLAAGGYPGDYQQGKPISGLPVEEASGEKVFHAGSQLEGDTVVTAGGRVLCATALGHSVAGRKTGPISWRVASSGTASSTATTSAGAPSSVNSSSNQQGPQGPLFIRRISRSRSPADGPNGLVSLTQQLLYISPSLLPFVTKTAIFTNSSRTVMASCL